MKKKFYLTVKIALGAVFAIVLFLNFSLISSKGKASKKILSLPTAYAQQEAPPGMVAGTWEHGSRTSALIFIWDPTTDSARWVICDETDDSFFCNDSGQEYGDFCGETNTSYSNCRFQ